jgi:hypothetical protein
MSICTDATVALIASSLRERPWLAQELAAEFSLSLYTVHCAFFVMRQRGVTIHDAPVASTKTGRRPRRYWLETDEDRACA